METGRPPELTEQSREIDDARDVFLFASIFHCTESRGRHHGLTFQGTTGTWPDFCARSTPMETCLPLIRLISGPSVVSLLGRRLDRSTGVRCVTLWVTISSMSWTVAPVEQIVRRLSCLNKRSSDFRALQNFQGSESFLGLGLRSKLERVERVGFREVCDYPPNRRKSIISKQGRLVREELETEMMRRDKNKGENQRRISTLREISTLCL